MKTTSIFCLGILLWVLTGCEKNSIENGQISDPVQLTEEITNSSWIISSMVDSGKDETHHFSGYTFTFGKNGILTATNGQKTYQGIWSITNGSSSDDSPNDLDFNIFFNVSDKFEELNDDWDIIANSDRKIELIDISGGNGGTDYLTFIRK